MKKLIILSASIICTWVQSNAQNVVNEFWETDGPVNSSVRINNKLYIGGEFMYAGPTTGSFAAFSLGSGNSVSLPVKLTGKVNDMVKDNSGRIYIAGRFSINGNAEQSLIRLTASLTLDNTFQFNFNGEINQLAINGNNLYAAGNFSNVNSQMRLTLAAIDIATNTLSSFAPNPDGQVYALAVANGNLYVGGLFGIISATSRNSLAAYSSSNALLSLNIAVNGKINALAVKDSLLFAGGSFDSIGGIYRKNIGSINLSTPAVRSWQANVTGTVNDIAINLTSVYIGGSFSQVGTQTRNNLAAVNIFVGLVDAFDPGLDAEVTDLKVNSGLVFVGGTFNSIGFDTRHFFAGIGISSALSQAIIPLVNGPVGATLFMGDTIFAAGDFSSFGGKSVYNLAAFDYTTGSQISWPVSIDGPVKVMKAIGTEILVGGNFQSVNQQFRQGLALIDTIDGTPSSFDVECDGYIYDAILAGSNLYLAGSFGYFGTSVRNNLAMVNATTGTLQSWNPNINAPVTRLMLNQTQLYAMGEFTAVGAVSKSRIASFDLSNNGALRSWTVNADSTINTAVASGSNIIVGGLFSNINGQSRTSIAAVDSGNAATSSWQTTLQGGVQTLHNDNGLLFAGGNIFTAQTSGFACFSEANGQEINFPVKLADGHVSSISQLENRLVLGGEFTLDNSLGKSNFSIVNLTVSTPGTQASSVSFSQVMPTSVRVHFNKGNGNRCIVLAREASAVDSFPLNGQVYSADGIYGSGNNIGSNYVVYNGTDSTFVLSGLNFGTTYHVSVFTFNGFASFTNYLTLNPATGNATTIMGYNPPTVAASNITFADVRVTQMVVKWTKGNGTRRYLIGREAAAVNQIPSDSTQYLGGSDFSTGTDLGSSNYVTYDGTGDSVLVTNLKGGITYHFKVYEYNGTGLFSRVLTTGAPAASTQMLSKATEPTSGSSAVTFSNTTKQSTQINWVNGNGSGRIVVASEGAAVVTLPADGETYTTDNTFNGNSSYLSTNERVVYIGTGNQFTLSGLNSNTSYHIAVLEFNGTNYTTNYQASGFVRGNVTTENDVNPPVVPAKNIVFTKITKDSVRVKWTKGDGQNRLVIMKKDVTISALPVQGRLYAASLTFGSGDSLADGSRVVSYGNNDSIRVSNLIPNTRYYIAVFEANESGSGPLYLKDSFALSSFFTLPNVGIKKINKESNIKVYPNPLRGDKLYIELDKALLGNESILITDILGKTVYTNMTGKNETGQKLLELEVGSLNPGQYLMQFISPNQIFTVTLFVN